MVTNIYCSDNIIENVICALDNDIFLSEADFQFSFAQKLDSIIKAESNDYNIILEYPYLSKDLYGIDSEYCKYIKDKIEKKCIEDKCKKKCKKENDKLEKCKKDAIDKDRSYIDLYFKNGTKDYYIEFKYNTATFKLTKCGTEFCLCDQSAYADNKYYILEDIERLEQISCDNKYLIFLTNDSYYWNTKNKHSIAGEILLPSNHYNYSKKRPLKICNEYKLEWKPFKTNGNFQVLILPVKNKN